MAFKVPSSHLNQRLLRDIDELIRKPYPNIDIHIHDGDLSQFCLLLSPAGWVPMHLTVSKLHRFPLHAPSVRMDSDVIHPNVFGNYICASILNTYEGYTPAYTLKNIAIQLLSFFGSEHIEQISDGEEINLSYYRSSRTASRRRFGHHGSYAENFACSKCQFGITRFEVSKRDVPGAVYVNAAPSKSSRRTRKSNLSTNSQGEGKENKSSLLVSRGLGNSVAKADSAVMNIDALPTEILLLIVKAVEDFEDLTSLAQAWPRVSQIISEFDVVRQRELQCFVSKMPFNDVVLGVGVSAGAKTMSSEFDLLSQQAYHELNVRVSVHHVPFEYWLPLPISRLHWDRARDGAYATLEVLKQKECFKYDNPTKVQVLYQFMNDIVVRLNEVEISIHDDHNAKSTLTHASEKAIESYFHLFHLLVCLATEDDTVVRTANRLLLRFRDGKRSKTFVPNLGHLLVALLISDVAPTTELCRAIITEAITRNVVWTLKSHPQLAYKEPDEVSAYRLDKTFEACRTSYRLLMFSELFRRTARPANRPLDQVRAELFDRHGGPPPGAASHVAAEVRHLHRVSDFTHFMREMGFTAIPTAANFTRFLRRTLDDSVKAGYSREAISQANALALRLRYDGAVGVRPELRALYKSWKRDDDTLMLPRIRFSRLNFFPERRRQERGGRTGEGKRIIPHEHR
jgi:ubiquitin-protein ligase